MQSANEFYPYIRLSSEAKEEPSLDEFNINERTYYYLKIFSDFKELNKKISWNWSAALFGFLWMAYRRMYLYTILYILIFYVGYKFLRIELISLLYYIFPSISGESLFKIIQYQNYCRYAILFFMPGLLGNVLYYSFIKRKISKNAAPVAGTSLIGLIPFLTIGIIYFSYKVLPTYLKLFEGS